MSINNPILPDRSEFLVYYNTAVVHVNATIRRELKMATGFYAKTGSSVFEASYRALEDRCAEKTDAPLHVINAPAGSGKTSFAYAMALAVTNYADDHKDAPYGCAIVVEQIVKADEVYKELEQIAPAGSLSGLPIMMRETTIQKKSNHQPRSSIRMTLGVIRSLS